MNKEELKLQREVKEWLATDHNGYTVQSLMNFIRKQTEPRDKCITELEAKLEKETAQRIYNFNKSIEWKEKHRKLEKENLDNESEAREVNIRFDELLKKYMLQKSRLTEAKELLKKFVECDKEYEWNLQIAYEAEQFLSEVEK